MNVTLNGSETEMSEGVTVADLVEEVGGSRGGRGVAVALNGEVVPRARWDSARVSEGDRVEVLRAVGGGSC